MKFSKHQEEIITKIAEGTVFDIVSYLKEFNLTTYKKLDKKAVEEIVKTKEDGKTYKKLKDGVNTISMRNSFNNFQIHNSIDYIPPREEDYEQVEAVVDFSKAKISTETSHGTYTFNYFDGINVTNSFLDIKEFLTIWQFLKSEGLVLEVDKKVSNSDYEVFVECRPIEKPTNSKTKKIKPSEFTINGVTYKPIENQPLLLLGSEPDRIKDFRDYVDYICVYNKENEVKYSQFIDKQIIGNPDLDLFIKRKFRTKEQMSLIHSLIPAYLALALTVIITIWQECDNSTDKQFEQIQNQLLQIEQTIENSAFDDTTLDDIEKQLEEMGIELNSLSGKEYDDSKIIKKLEELLEELKTENNE